MDASVLEESAQLSAAGSNYDILSANNSFLFPIPTTCALCQRILSSGNESGSLETLTGVCGDCGVLLVDVGATSPDVYQRRLPRSRSRIYGSSESVENLFPQQFSELIALERQSQSAVLEHDSQFVNGYGTGRSNRRASSLSTPNRSRRWRRVFSDTESDGFDSLYGDSESNASIMRYRFFHGDGDALSSSAFGGDSDMSADGQSYLEVGNFGHSDGVGDLGSDTDIDPMNAGVYQWNSEDESEEDDGSEWEEANVEENLVESLRTGDHLHGSLGFNRNDAYTDWRRQMRSPRVNGRLLLEELNAQNYARALGDYLDARLEHLAETDIAMMGAPPAAVSLVNNLPEIKIDGRYENLDNLSCAICKECLTGGTVVNQLPCLHLYHPSCILPWLRTRNTCPLCRYELPTDDMDYEERKRNEGNSVEMLSIHLHDANDDASSDDADNAVADEHSQLDPGGGERGEPVNTYSNTENCGWKIPGNRWFFAAAVAPIITVFGISLMLWLGKPSVNGISSVSSNVPCRRENGQRRWWSFF